MFEFEDKTVNLKLTRANDDRYIIQESITYTNLRERDMYRERFVDEPSLYYQMLQQYNIAFDLEFHGEIKKEAHGVDNNGKRD